MKCGARLRFEFPTPLEAENARISLGHGGPGSGRCKVSVSSSGNVVEVSAEALDSVALRAVVNTYLRNMKVIEGINGEDDG